MDTLDEGTLDPSGGELHVADVIVRAPGVGGHITVMRPSSGETRGEALNSAVLAEALAAHEVDTTLVLELSNIEQHATDQGVASRSSAPGANAIELQGPADGEGFGQVALVTDENGVATWHWPQLRDGTLDTTRAGDTVTFVVPGYTAEVENNTTHRGVLGWLGKKVVRVLSYAMEPAVGRVGAYFAAKWEDKNRPYAVRRMAPDNYTDIAGPPVDASDWVSLNGPRSLLFIHGTFSRAGSAFSGLSPSTVQALYDRYGGRVFAFDHKTLSEDPTANGRYFVDQMPAGQALDVDIVCHSRGGHVSRVLAERQSELELAGKSLNVNQVVFVASPNRGTVLADAEHMGDFIDAYTNILSLLPDNAVTDVLEAVIALVKQVATAVLEGLDGLQAMNPSGAYLAGLNSGGSVATRYRAIAADFEPGNTGFKPWAKDHLMDRVFKEPNDLVVPTTGVFEDNGDPMFPIGDPADRLDLSAAAGVHHGNFFSQPEVQARLLDWLTA